MEDTMQKKTTNVWILIVFFLCVVAVLVMNYRHFFVEKNYDYLVEAPCDSSQETCFVRNCAETPDDCGVNTFSPYKTYYLSARDFAACGTTACVDECASGAISCTSVICDASIEEMCESPELTQ